MLHRAPIETSHFIHGPDTIGGPAGAGSQALVLPSASCMDGEMAGAGFVRGLQMAIPLSALLWTLLVSVVLAVG